MDRTLLAGSIAAGTAVARLGHRASANRLALTRGHWAAEACLAIAAARAAGDEMADTDTIDLGRTVTCAWTVDRPDARLDLNRAPKAALTRLTAAVVSADELAEQFATAVVEARRVAAFTTVEQVAAFPGADASLLSLLSVDGSGRVDAATAHAAVLASLPGITPEAVATLVRRRQYDRPIRNFDELGGALSPGGRAAVHASYAELVTLMQFASTRLVISAEGWVGARGTRPRATTEVVLERLPDRLAVLRRRLR